MSNSTAALGICALYLCALVFCTPVYAQYVHDCASMVCLAFAEQQPEAQPASQPADFWDTGKGMDLGAVVRDLQGTSTDPVMGHNNAQHHAESDHSDSARQPHDGTPGSAGADQTLHIFSLHDIAITLCQEVLRSSLITAEPRQTLRSAFIYCVCTAAQA